MRGQAITFAIRSSGDERWANIRVRRGKDTVRSIAAERGFGDRAQEIATRNDISNVRSILRRRTLQVPVSLRKSESFTVLAGDEPPRVVNGYAKFTMIDRPQRTGLTHFTGYNPVVLEIPVRFESFVERDGIGVERDITLLERMAGRGVFQGAGSSPPAVIRVSAVNKAGDVVPLVPKAYQWSEQNPEAPSWVVAGIDWDQAPLRARSGNRIRQKATIALQQHTSAVLISRAAVARGRRP